VISKTHESLSTIKMLGPGDKKTALRIYSLVIPRRAKKKKKDSPSADHPEARKIADILFIRTTTSSQT
jgi:hypothetical protein